MIQGAESTVKIEEDRVLKKRERKKYRHQRLDKKIREDRTETEERLLKQARSNGVNVPDSSKIDEETLEIEKINGEQLKDVLEDSLESLKELGENAARLHEAGIIHGDLTTRNALVSDSVYIIDFGLSFRSERIEDRAVDIHLLKQVLESSHPEVAEEAWQNFLEGYKKYENYDEVMDRLEEVEKRGRYK